MSRVGKILINWCLCQKLSLSPLYFNKTLFHKSSARSSLISGPGLNSSPLEAKNPEVFASFSNSLSTSWQVDGETVETVADFIWGAPKSLQMVIAAMKLKDAYSLEGKLWPTLDSILKNRDTTLLTTSQSYGFSSSHVWMWELDSKESWAFLFIF